MNSPHRIGINGLFLRKPGSGIGQVTKFFLDTFRELDLQGSKYTIYTDTPDSTFSVGQNGTVTYLKPMWQRDDRIRKLLWEHIQLPKAAMKDGVTHFLSLYQAPTEFPKSVHHLMVVHDIIPELFPEYRGNARSRLVWNLTKRALKKASRLVAVSQSTKRDLVKHMGIGEEKITVAYPSINPIFFQEGNLDKVLEKYSLAPGYLYHGGGLEIRKNTESVLMAYAAWAAASNTVPPLVISGHIHGSENPLATDVQSFITKLKLEEKVKLLGFVPDGDLPALYKHASLFVFPSKYEGFGMPVVEALSQGTAVLAERNSSLGEVGGESVFWVEQLTAGTLQASYQKALNSSPEEKSVRVLQAKNFSRWQPFAQKIFDTLIQ